MSLIAGSISNDTYLYLPNKIENDDLGDKPVQFSSIMAVPREPQ
jgi:hypothetical protein